MKIIGNGVCAPLGFKASGVHAGIRKNKDKLDLSLIVSDVKATASSVYTTNLVKGAPIYVTKENISDGYAQAIICNSGNANTCNSDGILIAQKECELLASELHIDKKDVIVASTGVIGMKMDINPFVTGIPALVSALASTEEASINANLGIMTTDTVVKNIAVEFTLGGKTCKIGAISKGSGMIHPNMATMLCFITTDVNISANLLNNALHQAVEDTFNMLSVDGDTSTNDMVSILANGLAGNEMIEIENEDYLVFVQNLTYVCTYLTKIMAHDGEGATKLVIAHVSNANSTATAKTVAKSVICSSLLKAAMFGADANWGRVLCAIGYSGAPVDVNKVDVSFSSKKGSILVCKDGAGVDFSEELAKEILLEDEISIEISLNDGVYESYAYGCDLTYDYVKINGDYRS